MAYFLSRKCIFQQFAKSCPGGRFVNDPVPLVRFIFDLKHLCFALLCFASPEYNYKTCSDIKFNVFTGLRFVRSLVLFFIPHFFPICTLARTILLTCQRSTTDEMNVENMGRFCKRTRESRNVYHIRIAPGTMWLPVNKNDTTKMKGKRDGGGKNGYGDLKMWNRRWNDRHRRNKKKMRTK